MADHQRHETGPAPPLHLFEGYGIEVEYMIVARDTLDVLPVCDEVLRAVAGEYVSDVEGDDIAWSNGTLSIGYELFSQENKNRNSPWFNLLIFIDS